MPRHNRFLFALVFSATSLSRLHAQCADGSPPPCVSTRPAAPAAREPIKLDPKRIAILPFRVTTTDTLLGEGFAELLATEFTGDGSPRSLDMATTLSAWRRAGGGLRTPLPRAKALDVARALGAGLTTEGSIVGLGRNITVSVSLINVADGSSRGEVARVSTNADSLDSALRQVAARLIGTSGAQMRSWDGTRYTDSPAAMRYYLAGLSAWRRGRLEAAKEDLDRAIAVDSSFAQAMFRRYLVALWASGSEPFAPRTWAMRNRLSPQERIILEGTLGTEYPKPRTIRQRHLDRERAAALLPDSPDAQYLVGDYWYHYAAARDPVNQLTIARDYLMRAAAMDSQATVLRHLVEIGLRLRDTVLLKKVLPAYARTEDAGIWGASWLVAGTIGDQQLLASLRKKTPEQRPESRWPASAAMSAHVPAALLDEMYDRWAGVLTPAEQQGLQTARAFIAAVRGRPAESEKQFGTLTAPRDRNIMLLALSDAAIGLDVAGAFARTSERAALDTTGRGFDVCVSTLWRMQHGDTTKVDPRLLAPSVPCATNVALLSLPTDRSPATLHRLAELDSIIRNPVALRVVPYDAYQLARAWERNGDPKRALDAIRYRMYGVFVAEGPWNYVTEGRMALAVGDTAGAVHAYRYYLELTADAEPVFAARRDSIRAAVAALTRRIVP